LGTVITVYWFLVMILVFANVAVHYAYIVPYLREHGHKHFSDWGSFGFFKRIRKYREIREKEGESLYWYKMQNRILLFLCFGLIGWMILLIGSKYLGWI
jgi:hypothetical protein